MREAWLLLVAIGLWLPAGARAGEGSAEVPPNTVPPLRILVMDPLALPLSCDCVPGFGQKDYAALAKSLQAALHRPVEVRYAESLEGASQRGTPPADVVIGQRSVTVQDAQASQTPLHPVLALTDRLGRQSVRGLVLVRQDDSLHTLADLRGRTIALGPVENEECHAAVKRLLAAEGLDNAVSIRTCPSIDAAVFALIDGEVEAAVVPEYLPVLLVGCHKIPPRSVRGIARTAPVPFLQVFVSARLSAQDVERLRDALGEASQLPELRRALESRTGFEPIRNLPQNEVEEEGNISSAGWTDWRGPRRDGQSADVPRELPATLPVIWRGRVTGPALAGIAATETHVVVADKDADLTTDIFRCFDAQTGVAMWTYEYPAEEDLDYTNAPRATPVIHEGLVYCQGAWGNLHCLRLATGEVVWERHLADDFGAEPPTWGYCVPPLVVDDKLVVLPGAPQAGIAALDRLTGDVLWQTPGHAAAYAPLIVGTFGGKRQIVGYDSASLAGWDAATGARLWQLIPPGQSDFHVGTPVAVDGGLLVATENNATRWYRFRQDGTIDPLPAAVNEDLAPDTCTPVIVGRNLFCTAYGELFCLDLADHLQTRWSRNDDRFYDHTNLIAGNGRVLMWTTSGDLLLLDGTAEEYRELAHHRPLAGSADGNSMSHPALVGDRLYLRDGESLLCLRLAPGDEPR